MKLINKMFIKIKLLLKSLNLKFFILLMKIIKITIIIIKIKIHIANLWLSLKLKNFKNYSKINKKKNCDIYIKIIFKTFKNFLFL